MEIEIPGFFIVELPFAKGEILFQELRIGLTNGVLRQIRLLVFLKSITRSYSLQPIPKVYLLPKSIHSSGAKKL